MQLENQKKKKKDSGLSRNKVFRKITTTKKKDTMVEQKIVGLVIGFSI